MVSLQNIAEKLVKISLFLFASKSRTKTFSHNNSVYISSTPTRLLSVCIWYVVEPNYGFYTTGYVYIGSVQMFCCSRNYKGCVISSGNTILFHVTLHVEHIVPVCMSLVEQELPTLPEHMSASPVFSGIRVTRSLVLCAMFVDHCLFFCPFSFAFGIFKFFFHSLMRLQNDLLFFLCS